MVPALQLALLALACIALYFPMLRADFVYDARQTILTFPFVHDLRNLPDLLTLRVMHFDMIDNNRPVYLLWNMLDWALWGPNPAGFHATNLLLHTAVVLLIFQFIRHLMPGLSPWVPFFCALLFAVHPVNSEAVAEISYRKDLIAAAGILTALNLAIWFQPRRDWKNLVLGGAVIFCLFLAVGVKENGVAGPPALICYWLLFRRSEPRGGWIALCLAASVVVAAFLTARFVLQPSPSVIYTVNPPQLGGSIWETLRIQPTIWAFYLRQIAWQRDLCADYSEYSVRNFSLAACLPVLIVFVAIQGWLSTKSRVACMGVALFWFSLLPVSNLIPMYRPMADRFLYVPMCGMALLLAGVCGLSKWFRSTPVATLAVTIAVFLASGTFEREKVWQNSGALWRDTVEKNPTSYTAADNLAETLINEGRPLEAEVFAGRSIQLTDALYAAPFALRAVALDQLGRTEEADASYQKAVELDARYLDPDLLVRAMVCEEPIARKMKPITHSLRQK